VYDDVVAVAVDDADAVAVVVDVVVDVAVDVVAVAVVVVAVVAFAVDDADAVVVDVVVDVVVVVTVVAFAVVDDISWRELQHDILQSQSYYLYEWPMTTMHRLQRNVIRVHLHGFDNERNSPRLGDDTVNASRER